MRIGLDFDNTIVCYDELFYWLAAERSLVPPGIAMTKSQVRDHLRKAGREDEWTRLQGQAYGPRIREASPFPGALDFISLCHRESIPLSIISHKTKRPFLGEPHDLHAAALGWLEHHGFFSADTGLTRQAVFLEETKANKLARIGQQRCSHFLDDLPEILSDAAFPAGTQRVLFSPSNSAADCTGGAAVQVQSVSSWDQLSSLLLQGVTS